MQPRFHPLYPRSRRQTELASRLKQAKAKISQLEDLLLSKDGVSGVDHNSAPNEVAARIREDTATVHHGFVRRGGKFDVQTRTERHPDEVYYQDTGVLITRITRSDSGNRFQIVESTLEKTSRWDYSFGDDGLVSVETTEEARAPGEFGPTTFYPGRIASVEQFEAHQIYEHMQSRFSALEEIAKSVDGHPKTDLNDSVGEVAMKKVQQPLQLLLQESRYGPHPHSSREAKESLIALKAEEPNVEGYIAVGGEIRSKLSWQAGEEHNADISYLRAPDLSQGSVSNRTTFSYRKNDISVSSDYSSTARYSIEIDGAITVSEASQPVFAFRPEPTIPGEAQ